MAKLLAPLCIALLFAAFAHAGELELPRVGTVGDIPPNKRSITIDVERDGTIRVLKQELSFPALRALLQRMGRLHMGAGRASRANAVLRIDRRVPWIATQWVLTACAEARIARVFHVVKPESGDGEGALALFLPTDKGLNPMLQEPDETLYLEAGVTFSAAGVEPSALYPYLMKIPAKERAAATFEFKASHNVPHGYAIAVVDVALRAGVGRVELFGTMIPPRDADLKAIVKKHAPPTGKPGIRFAGREIAAAAVKMPPVTRVRGKYAGWAPGAGDESDPPDVEELEEEEMEEEPEIPEEEVVEEPIETEEIEDHEMEEEPEEIEEEEIEEEPFETEEDDGAGGAIDDSPFTGPSTNRAVGIGGGKSKPGRGKTRRAAPLTATENAVERGLAWLASAQDAKSGGWPSPEAKHDAAVTGLAVLAFLGAGYTDRGSNKENPYAKTVRHGLRYLIANQREDGGFGKGDRSIYDSAIAASALCEAYWMTRNPRYKRPSQDAIDFLALARNRYEGWGHGVRPGKSNTAATAWAFFATKSAKFAGLDVDPDAFEGTRVWLEKVTDEKTGRAGFDKKGAGVFRSAEMEKKFPADRSRAMTAAALLCRVFLGEDPRRSAMVQKAAERCLERLPRWNTEDGSVDMTYWYFGTLGMFQVGGAGWRKWNDAMKGAIIESQVGKGARDAGSWNPVGPWGATGGRVYSTALMTMCLEVYYRYDRVFGSSRGASERPR